jgi:hypothetical protein
MLMSDLVLAKAVVAAAALSALYSMVTGHVLVQWCIDRCHVFEKSFASPWHACVSTSTCSSDLCFCYS